MKKQMRMRTLRRKLVRKWLKSQGIRRPKYLAPSEIIAFCKDSITEFVKEVVKLREQAAAAAEAKQGE